MTEPGTETEEFSILLIDDDTSLREVLVAYLGDQGIQTLWTDWLNAKLGAADISVDPKYGVWDPVTLQVVAPAATE